MAKYPRGTVIKCAKHAPVYGDGNPDAWTVYGLADAELDPCCVTAAPAPVAAVDSRLHPVGSRWRITDPDGWSHHGPFVVESHDGGMHNVLFSDGTRTRFGSNMAAIATRIDAAPVAKQAKPVVVKPVVYTGVDWGAAMACEQGPGIAAKSLTFEPWRPSVDPDHWIPDVGEYGTRGRGTP